MEIFTSNTTFPTTTAAPMQPIPAYWGYIGLVVAVIFFGSNYLPVKKFETGDGMFFQLVLCLAIWSVGFVVQCIRNFPQFYALPMLGGFLWTTGNMNTVPIIKCIGLGMGMIFWCTVSLIFGWASARFGWFGIKPQIPTNTLMNYIGVAFAGFSTIFYIFVKSENASLPQTRGADETIVQEPLLNSVQENNNQNENQNQISFIDRLNPNLKRVIGIVLATFSGVIYGLMYAPYLHVVDNYHDASQNGLDYVFSLYTGILISSVVYFSIYCIFKKNRPQVNPKAILPGFVSGWMWGIASCGFFIANSALSQAISFPIAASGPQVIASLYGIFIFGEVKGAGNLTILGCGFTFALIGSILCGLSK